MKLFIFTMLFIMAFMVWSVIFYQIFGWGKKFFHDMLGWHMPTKKETRIEGYTETSVCRHCGKRIMKSLQGNWFRY